MSKPEKINVVQKVKELVTPIILELGLTLWDVEFVKDGSAWILRLLIDNEAGVSIDDCEKVSRAVDKPLDEKDFIQQSYYLEVSSPGIERTLRDKAQFEKYIGSNVNVKLYSPLNGIKLYTGKLMSYDDGTVTVEVNNSDVLTFEKDKYSKISLSIEF